MFNFTIYTDHPVQFREALELLTNEKIHEKGAVCNQTVRDLRDICKFLLSHNDEIVRLEKLGDRAIGIVATSNLPMPGENKIDILQETLKNVGCGIKTYIAQITGEVE